MKEPKNLPPDMAWRQFIQSGAVIDYLKFKQLSSGFIPPDAHIAQDEDVLPPDMNGSC